MKQKITPVATAIFALICSVAVGTVLKLYGVEPAVYDTSFTIMFVLLTFASTTLYFIDPDIRKDLTVFFPVIIFATMLATVIVVANTSAYLFVVGVWIVFTAGALFFTRFYEQIRVWVRLRFMKTDL